MEEYFGQYVIGLHVRGPGRTHGVAFELRRRHGNKGRVPLRAYLTPVAALLKQRRNAQVFVSSDSEQIMRDITDVLGSKMIRYPSSLSEFGEMHLSSQPENAGIEFDRYKLGEDVLVEAGLLARTHYLVHGNSNVSNFVLCVNPTLEAEYVFA